MSPDIKEYHVIDIMPHKKKYQTENYATSCSKNKIPIRKQRKAHRNHKGACPLRVIELAYPSKRQCLETWKTRNKTLPIHMIDRLRRIINDENPKAPVKDAVNFFKRRKTKRRKSIAKIDNNINKRREQLKLSCGVFGYKIMKMLENPMHIKLSPHLAKIACIIDEDLSSMIHNSGYRSVTENDDEIQIDVVKKIAVWIDDILEESSHKLFLEDLKEIEEAASVSFGKNNEGNNITDHVEQIGNESVYHDDVFQQLINEEFRSSVDDKNYKLTEDEKSEERGWIEEIIFNAIDVTIDLNDVYDKNIDKKRTQNTDFKDIDLKDLKDYINVILTEIIEEAAQYVDKTNDLQLKSYDDSQNNSDDNDVEFAKKFKRTKDSLVIRSTLELVSKSQMNLDNTVYRNEDMSLELLDDGNKKVKFNNNDIDSSMEITQTMASHSNSENFLPILKTRSVTIHNDKTPKTIYVSDPTPFLLSAADESWPESTSFHNTKSLLKVSKSVLSLGELLEKEEEISSQSVKDSVEIINHLMSGYNEVVTEKNVRNPIYLNNNDALNFKKVLENVDLKKDNSNSKKNNIIVEELSNLQSNVLSANNDCNTNEEGRVKSSLLFPDRIVDLVEKPNQNKKIFTTEKLPNINIVQVDNNHSKLLLTRNKTNSPKMMNKSTQTQIETLTTIEKTIPETGSNTTDEMRNQKWDKGLDDIVVDLQTCLHWIRNITADVERLLQNECGGVKYNKLRNKIGFDSKSWRQQSKDLHKKLVILKCKANNLKVMPYKCCCNKNI